MLTIKKFLLGAILLSLAGIAVYFYYQKSVIVVKVIEVKKGSIEKTIAGVSSGTVEPLRRVRLQALLPLRVKEVYFKESERVKKRDIIVKLDDSEIRIKLDLQKAGLRGAELKLHETEERYRLATENYKRVKKLFEEGVIPDSLLDESRSQYITTGKLLEIARNAIREAQLGITLTEEEYEKTYIRAPFDGLISFLDATPGEFPSYPGYAGLEGAGMTQSAPSATETKPFCEVIDDSVLKVKVPFDEVDAMKIKLGQQTRITSDTARDRVFDGKVVYVSPVVSKTLEQNRTVDVEVDIDSKDKDRLPVGASADAEIILEVREDVLTVPTNVVIEREGRRFVYVVDGDIIKKRGIEAGISNWEYTQILDGLTIGERIISSLDVEGIEEGRTVRIRDDE